jgi:hypothetical protein
MGGIMDAIKWVGIRKSGEERQRQAKQGLAGRGG